MITKSKIDKIGNLLKGDSPLKTDEYQELLDWRNSYTSILEYYHTKIKSKIDNQDILSLSRRLKRIESIQLKLRRFTTMRLSTLQDVAGLRVVVKDENSLEKAFTALRCLSNRHNLKRVDNYHNNPKSDGYRGFHLIYQNEEGRQIEVQLRTELEHIWATAVEIYGELQATSFKTGSGDKEWKEFFVLLSSYFAIKESCSPAPEYSALKITQIKAKLIKIIKQLNVMELLNAYTNGIKITIHKYNHSGRNGKYAILELDLESKVTSISLFHRKDITKAIEIYTQKEIEFMHSRKNIVLINVDNMANVQTTYPNYFLDTKKLLELLAKIILGEF